MEIKLVSVGQWVPLAGISLSLRTLIFGPRSIGFRRALWTLWTKPEIHGYDASKESKTRAVSVAYLWGVSRELGRQQPSPVQKRRVSFGIAVSPWTSPPTI